MTEKKMQERSGHKKQKVYLKTIGKGLSILMVMGLLLLAGKTPAKADLIAQTLSNQVLNYTLQSEENVQVQLSGEVLVPAGQSLTFSLQINNIFEVELLYYDIMSSVEASDSSGFPISVKGDLKLVAADGSVSFDNSFLKSADDFYLYPGTYTLLVSNQDIYDARVTPHLQLMLYGGLLTDTSWLKASPKQGSASFTFGATFADYFEIQYAKKEDFSDDKSYIVSDFWSASQVESALPKEGEGGVYYIRIRKAIKMYDGGYFISDWGETVKYTLVKITKERFGGLASLMKEGYISNDASQTEFIIDADKDGWLSQSEVDATQQLSVGKKKIKNAKGLEYLSNVKVVEFEYYEGKTLDLSKASQVKSLRIGKTSVNGTIKINGPYLRKIECGIYTSNKFKPKGIDISACGNLYYADIQVDYWEGNCSKLVLPKKKDNLQYLALGNIRLKSLDLNKYKELRILFLDSMYQVEKIQAEKCKSLRYASFVFCHKLKNMDFSGAKKLVWVNGGTGCLAYTTAGVKAPKTAKVTKGNHGVVLDKKYVAELKKITDACWED